MTVSHLIPLRVDALSSDKSVRIVDTLLLDTSCWPIPLSSFKILSDGLEANAQYLADQILLDCEVMGMGRTARHFTGRLELWTNSLQQQLADQLRLQLMAVVVHSTRTSTSTASTTSTLPIRLAAYGVRIHDDVSWDPNLNISQLQVAQSIGKDLNLSDDIIQALAIDICEQVLHTSRTLMSEVDDDDEKEEYDPEQGGPKHRERVTAAWALEQRVYISNVAHLVAQYRTV